MEVSLLAFALSKTYFCALTFISEILMQGEGSLKSLKIQAAEEGKHQRYKKIRGLNTGKLASGVPGAQTKAEKSGNVPSLRYEYENDAARPTGEFSIDQKV